MSSPAMLPATVRCPACEQPIAADGPCEVYGQVRASETDGLRLDAEFVCTHCEAQLLIEDAGGGVFDRHPTHIRYNGDDFRVWLLVMHRFEKHTQNRHTSDNF